MVTTSVNLATKQIVLNVRGAALRLSPVEARQVVNYLQHALRSAGEEGSTTIMRKRLERAYERK